MLGLSVVGLTIYHTGGANRNRIIPADIIELVEGTRERELIVSTITKTNFIGMHIATNRVNLIELDGAILALIPSFVNYPAVPEWLASWDGESDPPMWTVEELFAYLSIGDHTNRFTRTPAIGTNAATYGEWPLQVYKTCMTERWLVLKTLKYTWSPAQWGSNAVCEMSSSEHLGGDGITNIIFADPNKEYTNDPPYDAHDTDTNFWLATKHWEEARPVEFKGQDSFAADVSIGYCTESSVAEGYGSQPALSFSLSVYGNAYVHGRHFWYHYGDFWYKLHHLLYFYTNDFYSAASSEFKSSRMESSAKSVSIPRNDYYFAFVWSAGSGSQPEQFEVVAVPSNTLKSSTTGYVKPPEENDTDPTGYASFLLEWDIDDAPWLRETYGADSLLASVYKTLNTNLSATVYQTFSQTNIIPCIHEWDVTRCK